MYKNKITFFEVNNNQSADLTDRIPTLILSSIGQDLKMGLLRETTYSLNVFSEANTRLATNLNLNL